MKKLKFLGIQPCLKYTLLYDFGSERSLLPVDLFKTVSGLSRTNRVTSADELFRSLYPGSE